MEQAQTEITFAKTFDAQFDVVHDRRNGRDILLPLPEEIEATAARGRKARQRAERAAKSPLTERQQEAYALLLNAERIEDWCADAQEARDQYGHLAVRYQYTVVKPTWHRLMEAEAQATPMTDLGPGALDRRRLKAVLLPECIRDHSKEQAAAIAPQILERLWEKLDSALYPTTDDLSFFTSPSATTSGATPG